MLFSSSTATGTELTVSGAVVLVTMTSSMDTTLASSFTLRFLHSQDDRVFPPKRTLYPSSFVTEDGLRVASFPKNNTKDYLKNLDNFLLISRDSGRDFDLTLTFLDTDADEGWYYCFVYEIKDEAENTYFEQKHG